MTLIFCLIIAYLLGSVSTAIVTSKLLGLADPRTQGSGNAGATNVLRTAGKKAGIITLIGDAAKGAIAVFIGIVLHLGPGSLALIALFAVIGHVFPVWFQFKGGKGVATAIGGLLVLNFWIGLLVLIVLFTIAIITRYVSLGSIIALIAAPVLLFIFGNLSAALPILIMALLVIWKHKDNIDRLYHGIERKLSF